MDLDDDGVLEAEAAYIEAVVDDFLLEEGLTALDSNQCWGIALATAHADLGCRAGGDCEPGFVRGKNHLKNKFCDCDDKDRSRAHTLKRNQWKTILDNKNLGDERSAGGTLRSVLSCGLS